MFISAKLAVTSLLLLAVGCAASGSEAQAPGSQGAVQTTLPDEQQLELFLLIGQSNMEGAPTPLPVDREPIARVWALGYDDCANQQYNVWRAASSPLHHCSTGVGPGDEFGKALAKAWPQSHIGLIPAALSGVDVDLYRKGVISKRRNEFKIPPDNKRDSAYEMVIERAKLAQKHGKIRAILWHQGESDNTSPEWVGKVAEIVSDLRTDLGLEVSVPFLAGELLYSGCCAAHNAKVNELPQAIPNAHVISARGLQGMDNFHFNRDAQHELGGRYAEKFLELYPTP
jgi:hypothetical protein